MRDSGAFDSLTSINQLTSLLTNKTLKHAQVKCLHCDLHFPIQKFDFELCAIFRLRMRFHRRLPGPGAMRQCLCTVEGDDEATFPRERSLMRPTMPTTPYRDASSIHEDLFEADALKRGRPLEEP